MGFIGALVGILGPIKSNGKECFTKSKKPAQI